MMTLIGEDFGVGDCVLEAIIVWTTVDWTRIESNWDDGLCLWSIQMS